MKAWIQLLRIAALPSALSNILIGFLLANQTWSPAWQLGLLLVSSACLYSAGMVLNDVFDVERDRVERPNRPVAAGKVSVRTASIAGFGLLLCGSVLAGIVSTWSLAIACLLATAIWLYDGPLKRTPVASMLMGSCRCLNLLLGASTATELSMVVLAYAAAIGFFVTGITLVAKNEAAESQSSKDLVPGCVLMLAGILMAAFAASDYLQPVGEAGQIERLVSIGIFLIGLPILYRILLALVSPGPATVQTAVILSLRSLILFDACMGLLVANGRPVFSMVILSLFGVSRLLGRVAKMT